MKDIFGECSVCLEEQKLIYIKCNHPVCFECYLNLHLASFQKKTKCPMCRVELEKIDYKKKYAILCLGKKTNRFLAETGGYLTVELLLYPSHNSLNKKIFMNIMYYDENQSKINFIQSVYELVEEGYHLVFSDSKKIKKWLREMRIDYFDSMKILHF